MVRANQLEICREDDTYFCHPCDRHFNNVYGALNHCRDAAVHQDKWCERCEWLFVSAAARQSHLDNSHHHNICQPCGLDFKTPEQLVSHDVDVHNMCTRCGKYFENGNNLAQHKRSHLPAEVECPGCDRKFSEFSAMIIHLESGSCPSGIDRDDIDNCMFDSFVIDPAYLNLWTDYYRYQCPDCGANFRFLSALCQHVASNACDQDPDRTVNEIARCIEREL